MRYALVDDATLEAAKRIEGKSITQNELETVGDILALDNLIQAILYCDQILYLDYKGRKSDCKLFGSFQRVMLDDKSYHKLIFAVNKMNYEYVPCIEGGRFTDDFLQALFHALGMEFRFEWEKKAGIYCLTPRIVRKTKGAGGLTHRKLLYLILEELGDASFLDGIEHRIPMLYDSEGQIINNCYTIKDSDGKEYPTKLSAQTDLLFKALDYMIFRSNLHLIAANELKAHLILSPIRSQIQWGGFNRFYLGNNGPVPQLADAVRGNDPRNAIRAKELPLFTFWIAEHMGGSAGFIRAAYELREEKEFRTARSYITEVCELTQSNGSGSVKAMESAVSGLQEQFGRITKKYRIGSGRSRSAAPYALLSIVSSSRTNLSSFGDFSIGPKTETSGEVYGAGQNFSVVFRSVLEDLICQEAYSEYFDAVTSKIIYKSETAPQNIRIRPDRKTFGPQGNTLPM